MSGLGFKASTNDESTFASGATQEMAPLADFDHSGFASKMLRKYGFKGRLGKDGQGIEAPVDAKAGTIVGRRGLGATEETLLESKKRKQGVQTGNSENRAVHVVRSLEDMGSGIARLNKQSKISDAPQRHGVQVPTRVGQDAYTERRRRAGGDLESSAKGYQKESAASDHTVQSGNVTAGLQTALPVVLFDSSVLCPAAEQAWRTAVIEVVSAMGCDSNAVEAALRATKGATSDSRVRHCLGQLMVPFHEETVDHIVQATEKSAAAAIASLNHSGQSAGCTPNVPPGLLDLLRTFKRSGSGWKTGLVHKGCRQTSHAILNALGLKDEFKAVVTSQNAVEPPLYPYNSMYTQVCSRLGAPPQCGVVVTNNSLGVAAALSLGMASVWIGPSTSTTDSNDIDDDTDARQLAQVRFDDISSIDASAVLAAMKHARAARAASGRGASEDANAAAGAEDFVNVAHDTDVSFDESQWAPTLGVGDECLAVFSEDGLWYKATITNVIFGKKDCLEGASGNDEDTIFTVQFSGYGNVESVNATRISPMLS